MSTLEIAEDSPWVQYLSTIVAAFILYKVVMWILWQIKNHRVMK